MTDEREKQLTADLLIEYERKSRQLKTAQGPMRDWGEKLFSLASTMRSGHPLCPANCDTVAHFPEVAALIEEFTELQKRVEELAARKRQIFGA